MHSTWAKLMSSAEHFFETGSHCQKSHRVDYILSMWRTRVCPKLRFLDTNNTQGMFLEPIQCLHRTNWTWVMKESEYQRYDAEVTFMLSVQTPTSLIWWLLLSGSDPHLLLSVETLFLLQLCSVPSSLNLILTLSNSFLSSFGGNRAEIHVLESQTWNIYLVLSHSNSSWPQPVWPWLCCF